VGLETTAGAKSDLSVTDGCDHLPLLTAPLLASSDTITSTNCGDRADSDRTLPELFIGMA
jgi:hypothetical protein